MKIELKKTFEESKFLDPNNEFRKKTVMIEIREDPITGLISRILGFRFKLPISRDPKEIFTGSDNKCPFCADNINEMTCKFITDFQKPGRIKYKQCFIIPNAFPYSKFNSVVVFSDKHFMGMGDFDEQTLTNAFVAAKEYLGTVLDFEANVRYCSVNWNYMPAAGAGIIHPHLQILVDESPTWLERIIFERSKSYYEENGSNIWKDLLEHEKESNVRYIGAIGPVSFISAFAPSGMMGEIIGVFEGKSFLKELSEEELSSYSKGLIKIFKYFAAKNISGFNLCLYSARGARDYFWVNSRIVPRTTIPPFNVSDINYVEKLHKETVSAVVPEEMCNEVREFL